MNKSVGQFNTATSRWAGVGPYYAMFPAAFCDKVIQEYSSKGDTILDPFAGRGTSLYSAATAGRNALGIERIPSAGSMAELNSHLPKKIKSKREF